MCFGEPKLLTSSNYKIWVEHSSLDGMLEHVLPIRFAEVVEREVLLGNVSRIKKRCYKNVIPRLHFRVAASFCSGCRARILTSRLVRPFVL
jgi:hypothetical protein